MTPLGTAATGNALWRNPPLPTHAKLATNDTNHSPSRSANTVQERASVMDVTNRHRQALQPRIDSRYVYEGSQPQDHNNFWENLGKLKILVIVIKTNLTKNQKPKNRENPIKINKIQFEEDHIVLESEKPVLDMMRPPQYGRRLWLPNNILHSIYHTEINWQEHNRVPSSCTWHRRRGRPAMDSFRGIEKTRVVNTRDSITLKNARNQTRIPNSGETANTLASRM